MALSEHERGMLLSSMAPSSCGLLLGRSEAWVRRQRDVLLTEAAEVSRHREEPARPRQARTVPRGPSMSQAMRRPAAPIAASGDRIKPVTADIRRWVGYFLTAGWAVDDAAALFNVAPEAFEA